VSDDERFVVAHGLRVKGFASATVVASIVGCSTEVAVAHLTELRDAGHAQFRDGKITGWSLTAAGRIHHAMLCASALAASDAAPAIGDAYRRFLVLNTPLLAACTSWQLIDGTEQLNVHDDSRYDADVIRRLDAVHADVLPILRDLTSASARFGGYAPRLAHARERIQTGERDWFTGAMIESYHTVWFELHEDLLTTLGIERSKEST
jgi:hypothetical protein